MLFLCLLFCLCMNNHNSFPQAEEQRDRFKEMILRITDGYEKDIQTLKLQHTWEVSALTQELSKTSKRHLEETAGRERMACRCFFKIKDVPVVRFVIL